MVDEEFPVVKKSNILVRAQWGAKTVWAYRMVAWVASQIKNTDQDFEEYTLDVRALLESTGRRFDAQSRKELQDGIDDAMSHLLHFQYEGDDITVAPFSICKLNSEGILKAQFHPVLKPHYLNLRSHFTKYALMDYLSLKSRYGAALYELLKSYESLGSKTIRLKDLHEKLEVPPTFRRIYAQFKKFVLESAKKDIEEHTSMRFSWKEKRLNGENPRSKVVSLEFLFSSERVSDSILKTMLSKKTHSDADIIQMALDCFQLHYERNEETGLFDEVGDESCPMHDCPRHASLDRIREMTTNPICVHCCLQSGPMCRQRWRAMDIVDDRRHAPEI